MNPTLLLFFLRSLLVAGGYTSVLTADTDGDPFGVDPDATVLLN